jgi:hypothetical protein
LEFEGGRLKRIDQRYPEISNSGVARNAYMS